MNIAFVRYERSNIRNLAPYVPGEQPQAGTAVKLNTNENPHPPAVSVMAAIHAVSAEALRRYPPPTADTFCRTAARAHGLSPQQVIATNGGDELLRLAVTVFCEPARVGYRGAGVGVTEPTYGLVSVLVAIHDTVLVSVPLDEKFALPIDFADQVLRAGCRLVVLVNPHSPSGHLESTATLAAVAQRLRGRAVLLIDEAYVDFATGDAVALLLPSSGLDNVLLLRTLSKGYSLAGLRFGYGLGHPTLVAALQKARDSFNTDVLAQAAATASLNHRDSAAQTWRAVIDERQRMTGELTSRGYRVIRPILSAPACRLKPRRRLVEPSGIEPPTS